MFALIGLVTSKNYRLSAIRRATFHKTASVGLHALSDCEIVSAEKLSPPVLAG